MQNANKGSFLKACKNCLYFIASRQLCANASSVNCGMVSPEETCIRWRGESNLDTRNEDCIPNSANKRGEVNRQVNIFPFSAEVSCENGEMRSTTVYDIRESTFGWVILKNERPLFPHPPIISTSTSAIRLARKDAEQNRPAKIILFEDGMKHMEELP